MQKRYLALIAGVVVGLLASLASYLTRRRWLGRLLGLSQARYGVKVRRGLPTPMADGVILRADHYSPAAAPDKRFPTILMRTPYDRRLSFFNAQRFAERGYHVVQQDVRGRFGSDGLFEPFANEQADSEETLRWLCTQPWFDGRLGVWGASYVGYAAWTLAVKNPPQLGALVQIVTTSRGIESAAPPGVYPFELLMRWILLLDALDSRGRVPRWQSAWRLFSPRRERLLRRVLAHLPMEEAGEKLVGEQLPGYTEALALPLPERFLRSDIGEQIAGVQAPACFVGGWYDIFLQDLLADYGALRSAGQEPHLTIGPWTHMDNEPSREGLRQGVAWFDRELKGIPGTVRKNAVRLYLLGANEWREMPAWPPAADEARYYLHPGGALRLDEPEAGALPDQYRYDPADPTPSLGGPLFMSKAGAVDNRPLEARSDVLVYSSLPLTQEVTVIGAIRVELFVRSDLEHTDFFARLCDVHPNGRSMNLCDGIIRLAPGEGERQPDGNLRITVDMWATANTFRRGHSIRLQISSGAHPRFDRNLGCGEAPGKGVELCAAEQTIFLDPEHPSALVLPVVVQ